MKISEYGYGVLKKAQEILKENRCICEYPNTDDQILNENKLWRFMVVYGKDNGKENGYYTDKNGNKGNRVFYHMEKNIWTCTCLHYAFSGSENCKHICSCKLRMDTMLKGAKERKKVTLDDDIGGKNGNKHEESCKGSGVVRNGKAGSEHCTDS